MPDTEKFRIAAALYASARATNPAWPTDVDRLEDLQQHLRMRRIWDRAANVGR